MTFDKNISDFRRDYKLNRLDETAVPSDPFDQFSQWFNDAINAGIDEVNAMTLATVDSSGLPSARIVLLKGLDSTGFLFFTNYKSRKGRELSECPNAALVFFWKELERQIRISGNVEKLTPEESKKYFNIRPRESRIGAWASKQSEPITSRKELETIFSDYERQFSQTEIPLPDFWGGYRVIPYYFEYWQGRENRLHDRIVYEKTGLIWKISRLCP